MKRVTTAEIRRNMAELVNRAAYGGERFVVTRHGKGVAALVPLEDAALLERMRKLGMTATGGTPEDLVAYVEQEREKWSSVIERAGIKLE